ncbi:hypothetical protein [Phenylobacterium sp.]|uniref:hypothetical protein n=1 Tax=Phenylobacterium sp. TaxID=1871053 RepID=UPI0025D991DB|nr:hypothetical protein [Phenylobacterium sp.]MCA3586123.1 hypothetical protein [Methylocystis sp.]MCA6289122.1 hypothetical protein [Phenylobacterium sp.]MCA6345614.1 hypothetical protein [Phenylobacterium sp.]MCA6355287.1 hypothetical protein [Phenylobacterium sp.]MCA6358250.1 hypothetical protein [Phenylobacterium sp.]
MAYFLKERHHLLALRITRPSLDQSGKVVLELQRIEHGVNTLGNRWEVSASELGAAGVIGPSNLGFVNLPPGVLTPLTEIVEQTAEDDEPLWLHLVKPYGVLGALDWEGALTPHLNRAVLRVPDFLERPRENRNTLTVALICDLPSDEPRFDLAREAQYVASEILQASPRPDTTVHIFASRVWADRIAASLPASSPVLVHTPQADPDGRPLTWMRWIEAALGGQSVDLIHFLAHGYMVEQSPALALTKSPDTAEKERAALFVGSDDIALTLTRTGAWACGFSIPPDASSGAAVRYLADNVAQARPGPVFCHTLTGGSSPALEEWTRFLFSPWPGRAPQGVDGFAYCQPDLVFGTVLAASVAVQAATVSSEPDPIAVAETADPSPGGGHDPAWVSAAKRFSEGIAQQGQSWTAAAASGQSPEPPWSEQRLGAAGAYVATLASPGQAVSADGEPNYLQNLASDPTLKGKVQGALEALAETDNANAPSLKDAVSKAMGIISESPSPGPVAGALDLFMINPEPGAGPSSEASSVAFGVFEAAAVDDTLRDLQQIVALHMGRGGER